MVTTVGTENTAEMLITNLMKLEHDAIAAYERVIDKLDDADFKAKVTAFKADHDQHIGELKSIASNMNVDMPEGGDLKKMLTTGKIELANLAGDSAILKAMKTNEDDTVQAYQQARENGVGDGQWNAFFEKALEDEKRHRAWFESAAQR